MSVRFITGKPGGGKSYYALRDFIIPELRQGKRRIVTNLDLDLAELAQYLHDEYGETFGLRERLRLLDVDETAGFWLHYAPGMDLTEKVGITMPNGKKIQHVDYSPRAGEGQKPVLYVIDEVHEYFNARHWQHTGDDALHYLSQHRKMGDDIVCITQSLQNVDKQFRSVGQDFTYVRNHGKESLPMLFGFFKSVSGFSRSTYLEPFTGSQSGGELRFFKLDPKLAKCYRTAGGVGMRGTSADVGQDTRRAFHPVWLVLLLCACAGIAWKGSNWASHKIIGNVEGKPPGVRVLETAATNATENTAQGAVGQTLQMPATPGTENGHQTAMPAQSSQEEKRVWLTGICTIGGKARVFLSDGRVYTSDDAELKFVSKQMAIIGQTRYVFAPWTETSSEQTRNVR